MSSRTPKFSRPELSRRSISFSRESGSLFCDTLDLGSVGMLDSFQVNGSLPQGAAYSLGRPLLSGFYVGASRPLGLPWLDASASSRQRHPSVAVMRSGSRPHGAPRWRGPPEAPAPTRRDSVDVALPGARPRGRAAGSQTPSAKSE